MKAQLLLKKAIQAVAILALPCISQAQQEKPFVIGEIAPLSGPAATVGTRLNQVARMWAEDVNARGGIKGRKIELITCNDEGRPEKAVTCARDLISKGSMLLINDSLAPSILATMPVVKDGPAMILLGIPVDRDHRFRHRDHSVRYRDQ